jgi:hypothetical protein
MTYPDKLGVYCIGNLKFYSKLEAIEMQEKTGIHLHWDFNEAVFDSYNWTIEPTVDLLELYRQRAQQIRDKYDYVILMFSGGADSTNVLDTFLNNDIKLDEVASYTNYEATNDKNNYMNAEIYRVVFPQIDKLKIKYPWLKHRVIDLTQLTVDFFNDEKNKFDWIYNLNMLFNPNAASRESLPIKIKEWADIINAGKKLCILWAHDKPRVYHENGRYVFKFIDIIDNGPTVKSIAGKQPYTDELFYWSPDKPEVLIKQAHIIKRYLESGNQEFISTKKSDLVYKTVNGIKYWLSNDGVHRLIYPKWDINTFTNGKPPSIIFTPRDTWFFNLEHDFVSRHNWAMGIEKLWNSLPNYWKNDIKNINHGLKGCISKNYYLN